MKPITVILSILFGLGITQNICAEDLPPLPNAKLEIVATLEMGPGNIAVTPEGRIIISLHQFYDPEYRVYVQDNDILMWPDGISVGPDGWMYATVNKLHRSALLAGGENRSAPPYYVVRFRAISEAVPGW